MLKMINLEKEELICLAYPQQNSLSFISTWDKYIQLSAFDWLFIAKILDKLGASWSSSHSFNDIVEISLSGDESSKEIFLTNPFFLMWLKRCNTLLEASNYSHLTDELQNHLSFLPILLIKVLLQKNIHVFDGVILNFPPQMTIHPVDLDYSFYNSSDENCQFTCHVLELEKELVLQKASSKVVIPISLHFSKMQEKLEMEANFGIKVTPRVFLKDPIIELVHITHFPQLQMEKSEDSWDYPSDPLFPLNEEIYGTNSFLQNLWPEACLEFNKLCKIITPIYPPVKYGSVWLSGTSPHTPFTERLTFRPMGDYLLTSEEIIHETAHIKLEVCEHFSALLDDDGVARYKHPWKDELRPLRGVLIGAHAFLAVLGLYQRMKLKTKEETVVKYCKKLSKELGTALKTLEKGKLTEAGIIVMDAMVDAYNSFHTADVVGKQSAALKQKTDLGEVEISYLPFKFATILASSLPMKYFDNILCWLETAEWRLSKHSFYEQWELSFFPDKHKKDFFDDAFLFKVKRTLESVFLLEFHPFFTIGAHCLRENQKIGIHTDDRFEFGETHRFLIQLNRGWENSYGGQLVFFNSQDVNDIRKMIEPTHGSIAMFECSNHSYHAVNEIQSGSRFTIVIHAWAKTAKEPQSYVEEIIEENKHSLFYCEQEAFEMS